jgi:hypothetical protein
MRTVLTMSGSLLIAFTIWDVIVTVMSVNGAGALTRAWLRPFWASLLAIHRRRSIHPLLALAGPVALVTGIVLWYALLGFGLLLLLVAHTGAVVDSQTGASATLFELLYFVSTTISSLGYGDLVPAAAVFKLVSTLATFCATIIVTASLSYVLSVLSAATEPAT